MTMYKIPTTENVGEAQAIARKALGTYAAKFELKGECITDTGWQHNLYEVTFYRLDMWINKGAYFFKGPYRVGLGIRPEPKTSEYLECLVGDITAYESISYKAESDFDMVQNYVDEYSYDSTDPKWLKHTLETVKGLKDDYPKLIYILDKDFTDRLYDVRKEIQKQTGENYDEDYEILELICIDPERKEDFDDIENGNYDFIAVC